MFTVEILRLGHVVVSVVGDHDWVAGLACKILEEGAEHLWLLVCLIGMLVLLSIGVGAAVKVHQVADVLGVQACQYIVGLVPVLQGLQLSDYLVTFANQVCQNFEDSFSSWRPGTGVVDVGVDDHTIGPAGVGPCHFFSSGRAISFLTRARWIWA